MKEFNYDVRVVEGKTKTWSPYLGKTVDGSENQDKI